MMVFKNTILGYSSGLGSGSPSNCIVLGSTAAGGHLVLGSVVNPIPANALGFLYLNINGVDFKNFFIKL